MTSSPVDNRRSVESAHVQFSQLHRALQSLSEGLHGLLDLLFPPRCPGCGVVSATFCPACRRTVRPRYRSHPFPGRRPVLAALWSAGHYTGPLRSTILRFKYRGRTDLARPLARLLADTWSGGSGAAAVAGAPATGCVGPPVIVPVPQHAARTRERGSMPATLLARALATQVGLPCAADALVRVRDTPPQVGLSAHARWANVRDAFGPGPDGVLLQGKLVLLVDDVATTGATLYAGAAACQAGGARRVVGLVVGHERA